MEFRLKPKGGQEYYASVILLPRTNGHLSAVILQSLEAQKTQIYGQRLVFLGADSAALLLLAVFFWFFTGRTLAPLEENRRQQAQFIASASHELRSPLSVISGYAELVRAIHWKDEDARNEDLDLIIEESNRMSEMVNDILDYSQLQSGYIRLHPEFFDLAGLAESETSHCAAAAETYGIRIHFESDPESVFITADPLKLSQVLRNLLYNAINHTPEGELITVALKQTGKTVRLSVKNPGTPISKEDQEIIWERYQRSQHQSGRRMGTGIGLSIVSTILDAHGMKYGVSSDDTETVFWFDVTVSAPPDPSLQADKT